MKPPCSVEGCPRQSWGRKKSCYNHYRRKLRARKKKVKKIKKNPTHVLFMFPDVIPPEYISVEEYAYSLGCQYSTAMVKLFKLQDAGLIKPQCFRVEKKIKLFFRWI